ncbi:MAG: hypothetical protein P4L79_03885 [Legionella sp.]|uniref:reprolysin-like metallopeptidase n=1 Tax=Legionella sp. TaxID=459 RepID=UPI00283E1453|nr:hypothetical protein [Legionella sp.]
MNEKSEILCPTLTDREFTALVMGRWKREPYARTTVINYTFDPGFIPEVLQRRAYKEHPNLTMESLALSSQEKVSNTLGLWRIACGETIEFSYKKNLLANQPGIIFALCKQFVHEGEAWNHPVGGAYQYSLICLSYNAANNPYQNTIAHEIGHALGIDHTHEIESVKQQLLALPQGRGCSVMGYEWLLSSPNNYCYSNVYCPFGEGYALVPGPLDKQICTRIYKSPPFSSTLLFSGLRIGFINSAAESAVAAFLAQVKLFNLDQETANGLSLISFILIRSYSEHTSFRFTNTLAILEFIARITNDNHIDLIHFIKAMSNIVGIMVYFYELYNNEDALIKLSYLSALLAASLAGVELGSIIGKTTGTVTNTIVDNCSALFNWGKHAVIRASNMFSPMSFFRKNKYTNDVSSESVVLNTEEYQPQERMI